MNNNKALHKAKVDKCDEWYTQYDTIEQELEHYNPEDFHGKTVYCPCDDYRQSNFVRYYKDNFQRLKLKRLIATCLIRNGNGLHYEYDGVNESVEEMIWDGSYDSLECDWLLEQADIVSTNHPFSLFQNFMKWCEHKEFIILGSLYFVNLNYFFPKFQNHSIWYGYTIRSGGVWFEVPDHYELRAGECRIKDGRKQICKAAIRWYTNMKNDRCNPPLSLKSMQDNMAYNKAFRRIQTNKWNSLSYQFLDEDGSLECPTHTAIPDDYDGTIAVPITFLDVWCPDQFDLLYKISTPHVTCSDKIRKTLYSRFVIRRRR